MPGALNWEQEPDIAILSCVTGGAVGGAGAGVGSVGDTTASAAAGGVRPPSGISSTWPTAIWLTFAIAFALAMMSTEMPNLLAMAPRVSPRRIVYVVTVGEGAGVAVAEGWTLGLSVRVAGGLMAGGIVGVE